MNSILCQLYMIPSFRKGILSLQEEHFSSTDKINDLLYQLKKFFEECDVQSGKLPDIKGFCYAFKDFEGNPTNPCGAIDAVEFIHTLLDRLDTSLKTIGKNDIVNKPLQGKFLHEFLSKSCGHKKGREENFYMISLDIKNKKTLEESLETFVQGEVFDGDNQMPCMQCQVKTDIQKRTCLLETPDHLCIELKRFEFNFDTFQKQPISDYYELPMVVDLKPFTHEGLLQAENNTEEQKSSQIGTYKYRLSGAIIYRGDGNVGSYHSLIKDRESDEQWYKIDTKGSEKFDVNHLPSEAFGVSESDSKTALKWTKGYAYVVFYDRIGDHENHVYEREP